MTPAEIIEIKREGKKHTREQIRTIVQGVVGKEVDEAQASAWLMAAFINGLDDEETTWLTQEIAASGDQLDLRALPKPWVDKHSTGGVGDKTTIAVLPILAACGITVVKMSGPGLGRTGGTIDKLQAIPGFRTDLTPDQLIAQAKEIGIALSGQTESLAPADGILYRLRGVTATVDSIPLIVSSILSKKIAGGAEIVILDVKCGAGAFMPTLDRAEELAKKLREIGKLSGLRAHTVISDMDQPLGRTAGNLIEVQEAIRTLRGKESGRFLELCRHVSALALWKAEKHPSHGDALAQVDQVIRDGTAKAKLIEWLSRQGGNAAFLADIENIDHLAENFSEVHYHGQSGWVSRVDADAVGWAVVDLGGGRRTKDSTIDGRIGIESHVQVGDRIERGAKLFSVYASDLDSNYQQAISRLEAAVSVSQVPVQARPVILRSD